MGFSSIGSFIIMFFAIIVMISSAFMIYSMTIESSVTLTQQQIRQEKISETSIQIQNVTADKIPSPDRTTLKIINDGNRRLDINDIDVYFDGIFIPRNSQNRTIGFKSPNVINPLHWDPDEILEINISKNFENGTHQVVITTEFGKSDKSIFEYN
ncbi:MAG: hypothetical protein ACQESF_01055 [Nanobdellota archaeon]